MSMHTEYLHDLHPVRYDIRVDTSREVKKGGSRAVDGTGENYIQYLVRELERKRKLGRTKRRW